MDEEGPGWHESGDNVPWWLAILLGAGVTVLAWLVILLIFSLA